MPPSFEIMQADWLLQLSWLVRVLVAAVLGALIGLERELSEKAAGLRTTILVSTGAALFTVLSLVAFAPGDPSRVAAQIVTGIGFLGAGVIFVQRERNLVQGVTTAANVWVVASIGMAAGSGMLVLAGGTTLLVLGVLFLLRRAEGFLNR